MILRFLLLFMPLCIWAQSAPSLDYYLPQSKQYNPNIPTPESVLGHQVGEWHITHDKLVALSLIHI